MKNRLCISIIIIIFIMSIVGCSSTKKNIKTGSATESSTAVSKSKVSDAIIDNTAPQDKENIAVPEEKADEIVQPEVAVKEVENVLLKNGNSGSEVVLLQKKLYNTGIELSVDGIYGNQTVNAIKTLQAKSGLEQTGNFSDKTSEVLNKATVSRDYDKMVAAKPKPAVVVTPAAVVTPSAPVSSLPGVSTSAGDSQQAIVVLTNSYGTVVGTYAAYNKINGAWVSVSSGRVAVGQKGFSDDRTEGDMTTPTGKYGIPFMFGSAPNPGVKFEYRQLVPGDYWESNTTLATYNIWTYYDGPDPKGALYDYEALWTEPLYKYAAVIDYNYYSNKRLKKGSGIFLHIAPPSGSGTEGCVGISEENLVNVLRWLDPTKKPCIIMGVKGHI